MVKKAGLPEASELLMVNSYVRSMETAEVLERVLMSHVTTVAPTWIRV